MDLSHEEALEGAPRATCLQDFIFAVLLTEFDVKEFEAGRYGPP